ncbi:SDR family NAD(P)-dependent oxidoreductase [Salibacterium qingdaonense]|uniref:3-oxoacyl-[acyl-carrier protein] reductase n=1 Tax=Salibacterium qingdaonense TaxID=266892 RepID=A0A1I4KKM0_9BACI|nr:SDR family NAD(P)-dependent oxidoreductase [Salibacterium qingdaonense]SFL79139.1 3-oxoacyl-[acyl-carrier protein] reductase [Salibacterium qingdaonense]
MLLDNQTAVVSGATRGIGRAAALKLAENGASLIVNGTNEILLQQLVTEVEELGQRCYMVPGNVADPQTADRTVEAAVQHFGSVDILVNNAGINSRNSTLDMGLEEWQNVLDVNLNGTLYFCKTVLPYMIENHHGKIVNVSSTAAKNAHKNAAPAYGASKAGVDYLTRHLALEMADYNINVNGVNPGPVETDMSRQWSEEYRSQVLSKIPLNRIGSPENVADAVLFLASNMSDFITGETININGGTYMN